MYETLKNQFAVALSSRFEADEITYIIGKLNVIANDYEITAKSKELAAYDPNEIPYLVKTFLVCKKKSKAWRMELCTTTADTSPPFSKW